MNRILKILAGGLLCLAGVAAANDHPNLDAGAIRDQQRDIRIAVDAGRGAYKDMPDSKKRELFGRQDHVLQLIGDHARTTELNERQQIDLFNNLEAIQAIVNSAEDERMICQRERPVGSNRIRTICKTVAQRRADRDAVERDTGRRTIECSEAAMGPGGCNN